MNKPWQKDEAPFKAHLTSLETKVELMQDYITPNSNFFVCNHTQTPTIDVSTYRLQLGGTGVLQPLELSYDALLKLPSRTLIAYLECAGSQRQLFKEVMGKQAESKDLAMTPWMLGGVGNAVWTGEYLRTIFEIIGLKP